MVFGGQSLVPKIVSTKTHLSLEAPNFKQIETTQL